MQKADRDLACGPRSELSLIGAFSQHLPYSGWRTGLHRNHLAHIRDVKLGPYQSLTLKRTPEGRSLVTPALVRLQQRDGRVSERWRRTRPWLRGTCLHRANLRWEMELDCVRVS